MKDFTIDLSQAELYWLASAFGYTQHALIHAAGTDPLALRLKGQESLQARGLVHRTPGTGWKVELAPAAFVRWSAEALGHLTAERFQHDGSTRRLELFRLSGQSLLVNTEKDTCHFLVTADPASLPAVMLAQLGVSLPDPGAGSPAPELIQPVELIRAAWEQHPHLGDALARQGQSTAKAWLEGIDWAVTFSRLQVGGDQPGVLGQALLCGNSRQAWGGAVASPAEKAALSPVDAAGGRSVLQALLQTLPE
jgi:hypothetical protein